MRARHLPHPRPGKRPVCALSGMSYSEPSRTWPFGSLSRVCHPRGHTFLSAAEKSSMVLTGRFGGRRPLGGVWLGTVTWRAAVHIVCRFCVDTRFMGQSPEWGRGARGQVRPGCLRGCHTASRAVPCTGHSEAAERPGHCGSGHQGAQQHGPVGRQREGHQGAQRTFWALIIKADTRPESQDQEPGRDGVHGGGPRGAHGG